MEDWREQYTNCTNCAEFQDNKQPTDMCNKCLCFNCTNKRSDCLNISYCKKEKMDIETLSKLI